VVLSEWRASVDEGDELASLAEALGAAEEELREFAADLTLRRALGDDFATHRDARVEAVEKAREAYEQASRATVSKQIAATELDSASDLDGLSRSMLASIVVLPGRGRLPERVRLNPL
jgi:hypothetical protein